jgi:hypothetical protein
MLLLAALAVWLYVEREALRLQWECFQVTSAPSYEEFRRRIEQFERQGHPRQRLPVLVARWRTGNATFDEHLSRYLYDPQCSEAIREAFSRELGWRKELVDVWAARWRDMKPDPEDRIASLRRYLETLHTASPPREITWRDVLDFQASLQLTGQGELAHRLSPDNWRGRFERWQEQAAVW